MVTLLRIADVIDRFNDRFGRWLYWLTLAMVLIGSFNAVARYLDRWSGLGLSSNMYLEAQWYLFSLVFLLGGAYALRHDAHVRVDILYSNLSRRGRAWVDLGGVVLFLIPFCLLMLWVAWPAVANSWRVLEMSPDPGGLPRYPIKTAIPAAFILLLAQGLSMGIRSAAVLTGHAPVTARGDAEDEENDVGFRRLPDIDGEAG
ncbi:MAG: TRAP transporter small permease subunit [Rhodothermales bacterium]|nr:TRAP transporter small permease subunit [Rhodothermales bacterium]